MPETTPVTRFAPSPTGHLHIGGARTALFCWAFARRYGGKFMIRIEDTDAARSSLESAKGILSDLAWLGIDNDLGPYLKPDGSVGEHDWPDGRVGTFFQAKRVAIYNRFLEQLVRQGRAYPAFDTNEETEAQRRAAVAAKQTYRYPRPADVQPGVFTDALAARWARAQAGERHVIRFVAPAEEIVVPDQVLGDVKIASGELDDFVIRKADGFPTYHFAVVIDDELMGVTHVLRAQEHLANTPRHVALQRALGFRTPVYGHMPLIFNTDGTKMSKRDKAKAARKAAKDALAKGGPAALTAAGLDPQALAPFLAGDNDSVDTAEQIAGKLKVALPEIEVWDFRRNGYLPEAINNFVSLLGWNPGMKLPDGKDLEKFDTAFLCQHFGIERIGKTNSKFDRAKLLSFNADFIGAMSDEAFADRFVAWMREHEPAAAAKIGGMPRGLLVVLARAIKPRAKTLRDALASAAFALVGDDAVVFDDKAVQKNLLNPDPSGLSLLKEIRGVLAGLAAFTPEEVHGAVERFAAGKGFANPGPVAQALRVAMTGSGVSPGIGETLAVLGRASVLGRLDRCVSAVEGRAAAATR
jgi:glutamyl/glutaminyl-tRNA synthetase